MRYAGLIAAIIFAAIAAVAVLRMSDQSSSQSPVSVASQEVKGVPVYIAKTAIPVGAGITKEMIDNQAWPEHLVLPGFMKADKENSSKIVGMVARGAFQQSEPIIESKLANPNDPNFLAGELPKGMRVVTIPLNEVDGVAGFVFPGDHVDLIYTHDIEKPVTSNTGAVVSARKDTVTETLLTNVKVVAVDQRASNAGATDSKGNLLVPKSASVMVSQADAQRVRLAQKTGTVSMALRSLQDKESADGLVLTRKADISQWGGGGDDAVSADGVKVVRGAPVRPEEMQRSLVLPGVTATSQVAP